MRRDEWEPHFRRAFDLYGKEARLALRPEYYSPKKLVMFMRTHREQFPKEVLTEIDERQDVATWQAADFLDEMKALGYVRPVKLQARHRKGGGLMTDNIGVLYGQVGVGAVEAVD